LILYPWSLILDPLSLLPSRSSLLGTLLAPCHLLHISLQLLHTFQSFSHCVVLALSLAGNSVIVTLPLDMLSTEPNRNHNAMSATAVRLSSLITACLPLQWQGWTFLGKLLTWASLPLQWQGWTFLDKLFLMLKHDIKSRDLLLHLRWQQLPLNKPQVIVTCWSLLCRVGQNHIYTPYLTVHLVICLPKKPYTHRIYMVMANPTVVLLNSRDPSTSSKTTWVFESVPLLEPLQTQSFLKVMRSYEALNIICQSL
jgi:hypothetical protein